MRPYTYTVNGVFHSGLVVESAPEYYSRGFTPPLNMQMDTVAQPAPDPRRMELASLLPPCVQPEVGYTDAARLILDGLVDLSEWHVQCATDYILASLNAEQTYTVGPHVIDQRSKRNVLEVTINALPFYYEEIWIEVDVATGWLVGGDWCEVNIDPARNRLTSKTCYSYDEDYAMSRHFQYDPSGRLVSTRLIDSFAGGDGLSYNEVTEHFFTANSSGLPVEVYARIHRVERENDEITQENDLSWMRTIVYDAAGNPERISRPLQVTGDLSERQLQHEVYFEWSLPTL